MDCNTVFFMSEQPRMLARLGAETAIFHAEADGDVDHFLFKANATGADYRLFLERQYGFIAPLETSLLTADGVPGLLDLSRRAKAARIVHDLLALGLDLDRVSELPQCLSIPTFRGAASALGWMYVAERAMLASAVITRHLVSVLPDEMRGASSYLTSYAGRVGKMWRELGDAMDHIATTPAVGDRMVMSAGEAFRTLSRFRTQGARGAGMLVAGSTGV